ncbi:MAG: hypothetical protein LBM27_00710 [Lactobacillaceae bacterium]|jgi:hypothetical protein|nr:hypothetical protein [Lactobacillaceae bacterium]
MRIKPVTIFYVAGVVLMAGIFYSLFTFFNTGQVSREKSVNDATKILKQISSNNFKKPYIYGSFKSKDQEVSSLVETLKENVPLAQNVTYNSKKYDRDDVLNQLANKIYELEFSNLSFDITDVQMNNRLRTAVSFTGKQLTITNFLSQSLANVNDELQLQKGVDSLSQSQYALAEYVFLNNNWADFKKEYSIKGDTLKTTVDLTFKPGSNPHFQIDYSTAKKIQESFLK